MSRVFSNDLADQGSIPGRVIPKTPKMVLDAVLLNTQHYKVRIKGKVEQSREWSGALPIHLSLVAIEKGAFELPSTKVAKLTYFTYDARSSFLWRTHAHVWVERKFFNLPQYFRLVNFKRALHTG